jgi:uncharacterized protein YidB (DUF937 family)
MGLLDELAGSLLGGGTGQEAAGALQGLVGTFQQAGLGEVVASWIGRGENLPISAEQLQQVLGSEQVQALAARLGIDPAQAASQLSALLPGLVDGLTPEGRLPEPGALGAGLGGMLGQGVEGLLGGLLGGRGR